ncbi:hypothetical protein M413DRAFT_28065 [Hebeloma cylindrosporum]|uniref:Uncharacterized protein n=1 Tax=Hebeloma cylindrosporum TaxID=76867 RepID=A0A0C2XTE6_HEBCY|nr:hypothetical protein M413DRAFT_28065 [Hebeloma cylindrosporum h7]
MPPRPALQVKRERPGSAIYLGKAASVSPNLQDITQSPQFSSAYPSLIDGTPPSLPDLPEPEPPSPSSSVRSSKSGLPSPPATNSTGSSTGDPATIAFRPRPLSLHSNNSSASTSSGSHHTTSMGSREDTGAEGDFDDDHDNENDNENDGDDTARLDRRLLGENSSNEALQRVRSLAQRNRLALDKLSSRLGSPSPARSNTPARSPAPSHASLTSSRLSQPPRQSHADHGRSGSETERESTHNSHSSSSHKHSVSMSSYSSSTTSPAASSQALDSPYGRLRHLSAPGSPNKARAASSTHTSTSSGSSHSPSRRRRHRASMASMSQLQLTDFSEEDDDEPGQRTATNTARDRGSRDRTLNERDLITQSALAAVASSRSSPLGTRRRAALPKEFRSDLMDDSPSPNPHAIEPLTPFRAGAGRAATVREVRQGTGISPRWSSDDYRNNHTTTSNQELSAAERKERRQSLRGGSAESALGSNLWSPGGRLAGEGLRAAGLGLKKDEEQLRGRPSADLFSDKGADQTSSPQDQLDDGRRRVLTERERDKQPARASTSMAHYQYLESPRELRPQRSAYPLTSPLAHRDPSLPRRDRDSLQLDRAGSALGRYNNNAGHHPPPATPAPAPHPATSAAHLMDRMSTGSPFGSRRYTTQLSSLSSSQNQTEHTRLLFDSLAMFENQLAKLPTTTGNASTGSSYADLSRNAQSVVYSAERLAAMLRSAGARATEAQVDVEVESTSTSRDSTTTTNAGLAEIYGKVASDYRENARTADELVRGITALLLGVGKVVKDFGAQSEFGSPAVHARHLSLGGIDDRRGSPDVVAGGDIGSTSSGRHSAASRRSWEHPTRDRDREREDTLRRLAGVGRSESVLARASPSTFQRLRDREEQLEAPPNVLEVTTKNPLASSTGSVVSNSARRLFTPREQREQALDAAASASGSGSGAARNIGMPTFDSQETVQAPQRYDYETSPTPASRKRPSTADATPDRRERARTLTPLSIPKPLPTLPSESLVRRQPSALANGATNHNTPENQSASTLRDRERRRATLRGAAGVGGGSGTADRPTFPAITTPSNATTQVTAHTVSNTPHGTRTSFPLLRTDSSKSTRSQVTFSRPTKVSVEETLTDLQQQYLDSERRRTAAAASSSELGTGTGGGPSLQQPSGSETEREREVKQKTLAGARAGARMSLGDQRDRDRDRATLGVIKRDSTAHAADRSAATTILQQQQQQQQATSSRLGRERRRTVTDIWPKE